MGHRINIKSGGVSILAELGDSPTAQAIVAVLPLSVTAHTWGDEIYFPVPVEKKLDSTAVDLVAAGDLGYWPSGRAFCIFFGPTPASRNRDEIRPASAVNIIGKVLGKTDDFKSIQDGDLIELDLER